MMWVVTLKSSSEPLTASRKIIPIFYLKNQKALDTNSSFDIAGIQSFISCRRYKFEAKYWMTLGCCMPK